MRARAAVAATIVLVLVLAGATRGEPLGTGTTAIGLFLPANDPRSTEADELRRGAALAVEECAGGARECRLVAAMNTGQWSAGAGELVRLVYAAGVTAVLGPVDGRTAHLAEQVVTRAKGQFLLLTPWASDPTLTQIKVPWFFRLAPDDRQQTEALVEEIYGTRTLRKVMVVTESQYDFRSALEAFNNAASARGAPALHQVVVDNRAADVDRLLADVRASGAEAVLFLQSPDAAARAARRLREAGIAAPFFGPLGLSSPAFLDAAGDAADGMVLAAPPEASGLAAERFRAGYRAAHDREPSTPAAYGYDGAAVLIAAVQSSDHAGGESLRTALAATRRDGMTGRIEFDAAGNRIGPAPLARVERGRLRPIRPDAHRPGISAAGYVSIQ